MHGLSVRWLSRSRHSLLATRESAASAKRSARVFCESDAPAMPALPKALCLSRNLYLATRDPAQK